MFVIKLFPLLLVKNGLLKLLMDLLNIADSFLDDFHFAAAFTKIMHQTVLN